MSKRWYGLCPAQLEGVTADGRPFYYRSRGGGWTLNVGEPGWIPNFVAWPTKGTLVDSYVGEDIEDPDLIDALIDLHLGRGWRHITYEERMFDQECIDCKTVFRSEASNICTDCLLEKLRS